MQIIVLRIFLFCLIPIGILILIKTIKILKKSLNGDVILEMPLIKKNAQFIITKAGVYSIWQKGQYFRKMPKEKIKPVIYNELTMDRISLIPSIFRPNSNDGITFKMELFRFSVPEGKFRIEITEGSSVWKLESIISSLVPVKMVDYDKYYIQIRESQPIYFVIMGIILMSLAGFLIIGGLVAGILADQIFAIL
jgi:hypothetical protein